MKTIIRNCARNFFLLFFPELKNAVYKYKFNYNSIISDKSKLHGEYSIVNSSLDDYSYIENNSKIVHTEIGKFCSIGPNFNCGVGIHPTNGISTAPMFYAKNLSNGISLSNHSKVEQTKPIKIGNDVWVGINVTILDGVVIGDGAIIAAGSVVTKNIPDYAIYGGVPAKLIRYRFNEKQIIQMKKIKWWNFEFEKLQQIEEMFFEIDEFIKKN